MFPFKSQICSHSSPKYVPIQVPKSPQICLNQILKHFQISLYVSIERPYIRRAILRCFYHPHTDIYLILTYKVKSIMFHMSTIMTKVENVLEKANSSCKGKCSKKGNSNYKCRPCKNLKKKLCRSYHDSFDPSDELVGRLAYEVAEGLVSREQLMSGDWMERCGRDAGHHYRIVKLVGKICRHHHS